MQRGVLQLTKEEFDELMKVFHWDTNGDSILASKLQYASENKEEAVKNISVSEEDLELILDDIMPVNPSNILLKSVFDKINEKLRNLRELR